MMRSVTMAEVAREAGVSQPVVSKVLHGGRNNSRVSEATRTRVLKVARDCGYRANAAARAMLSGRFGTVALVLSTERQRGSINDDLLSGLHDELRGHDLTLCVTRVTDAQLVDQACLPRLFRERMVDGMVIDYFSEIPQRMAEVIRQSRLPSVWLNSQQEADCVYLGDRSAARQATESLLALGHRKIAYVDYSNGSAAPPRHYTATDRLAGYRDAMEAAGLSPLVVRSPNGVDPAERLACARTWLAGHPPVTAVLAYHLSTALPLIHAARILGLTVPDRLSVVTFCDSLTGFGLDLSAMVNPWFDVGRAAASMLVRKLAHPALPIPPEVIDFTFVRGGTIGPNVQPKFVVAASESKIVYAGNLGKE